MIPHDAAIYALRLGYKAMIRATKTSKATQEKRLANPEFCFRAKPIPGWVYYPATDTIKQDTTT